MEIQDYIDELEELKNRSNVDSCQFVNLEDIHMEADDILCEIISKYVEDGDKISDIFKNIDKWYA